MESDIYIFFKLKSLYFVFLYTLSRQRNKYKTSKRESFILIFSKLKRNFKTNYQQTKYKHSLMNYL